MVATPSLFNTIEKTNKRILTEETRWEINKYGAYVRQFSSVSVSLFLPAAAVARSSAWAVHVYVSDVTSATAISTPVRGRAGTGDGPRTSVRNIFAMLRAAELVLRGYSFDGMPRKKKESCKNSLVL
ncbi:hypothetical protein GWI33_000502 [Rhynchophorus ferrugineus]|uniref:Uncharacterized protein n=1 Tax=Rhynchophorus ferrugineus TaxID=354439 RepID=A0A834HM37_RHYFE|nr:hypothetical protein GWI33_000502 [Rhynchophorus ferrugineus]